MTNVAMEETNGNREDSGTGGGYSQCKEESSSSSSSSCAQYFLRPNPSMARYVYTLIFLATSLLAWTARDYGRSFLSELEKLKGCHGYRYCLGAEGVLRISFGCFMFFFVMFLSTVRTKKLQDPRNSWHSEWWPVKIIMWIGFMLLPFFVPTELVHLYGKIAHFGAGAFLVIQLISVISFITWLNACCYSEKNEQRCRCQVTVLSVAAYLASFVGIIMMYVWYVPSRSCHRNILFISLTVALLLLMTLVSVNPKVNTGYLAPGLMGLYIVFLCWSAIRSEPATEICIKKAHVGSHGDWLTIVSFVIAILVIVMATFSTGIDSKCLQFKKSAAESEDDVPYGFGFFHLVFAMGSMYFAMLFIGWSEHNTLPKWTIDVGWVSTWVRIVNEWAATLVYIWMMLAPLVLKSTRRIDAVDLV